MGMGKTPPPIEIALKLCDIFRVNLDSLVNTNLKEEGFPPKAQKDTSPEPGQKLLNRLLLQKLEEAGEELKKKSNPEAYRRLKLEELIRKGGSEGLILPTGRSSAWLAGR